MKKGEKKRSAKRVRMMIRFTPKDLNRIKGLARLYAEGNVTKWITYAAINAERKYL